MNANRDTRGQSLVEFALIVPIFVLVLIGIFDFGRAIYAFNTINQAAREAARLAIVDQTISHIRDEAVESSVSLRIDATDIVVDFRDRDTPDDEGSCVGAVSGDDNNQQSIVSCFAVVTVRYEYEAATPIIGALVGTINMEGESRFKVDFNCEGPECPIGES
jgi:Flp pilus assembly protein TadG